jgi:rhamnosyl/mannosyltransferase
MDAALEGIGGMSRLRIVHAAKFYPPSSGGMETVVGDLCKGTAGEWDVRVVAANEGLWSRHERSGDVGVVRAGTLATANSVPLCPSYPFHLWRDPADCVVLHEPNPVAGTALFVRNPARRLVIWHHADLLRPWWAPPTYGRLQRSLYRRADCVIVSSPVLAAESPLVAQARRVAVIPFGVSLERYRRSDPSERARIDRIRAGTPGPRVLFVGRFVYYKGVQRLIEAMAQCPGTLILVGEGPLEADLRRRTAALGLQDRVLFAGKVSDEELPAYYRASDVFVLPSVAKTEAFGVVQVEAMAAGLPVVSTNLPTGVPWVNQNRVTGLVVEPDDAGALAGAIRALLENADLRSRCARHAAVRADALFSRQGMIDRFREVVETAIRAPAELDRGLARAEAL